MNMVNAIKEIVSKFKQLYKDPMGIDFEYGCGYLDSLLIIAKASCNKPLYQQVKLAESDFEDNNHSADKSKVCDDLDGIVAKAKYNSRKSFAK